MRVGKSRKSDDENVVEGEFQPKTGMRHRDTVKMRTLQAQLCGWANFAGLKWEIPVNMTKVVDATHLYFTKERIMKAPFLQWLAVLTIITLATSTVADEKKSKEKKKEQEESASNPLDAQFDRLKSLAGDWVAADAEGEASDKVIVSYRVTAAGSAVIETLFHGTDHEMVSVYHRNGKELMMTHYCAAGNQPRMKAKTTKDPKKLRFVFAGGTNMDPKKDLHIHGALFTFLAKDRFRSEWIAFEDGKESDRTTFELARKK